MLWPHFLHANVGQKQVLITIFWRTTIAVLWALDSRWFFFSLVGLRADHLKWLNNFKVQHNRLTKFFETSAAVMAIDFQFFRKEVPFAVNVKSVKSFPTTVIPGTQCLFDGQWKFLLYTTCAWQNHGSIRLAILLMNIVKRDFFHFKMVENKIEQMESKYWVDIYQRHDNKRTLKLTCFCCVSICTTLQCATVSSFHKMLVLCLQIVLLPRCGCKY